MKLRSTDWTMSKAEKPLFQTTLFCLEPECGNLYRASRIETPCPECGSGATIPAANWAPAKYGMPKLDKSITGNAADHRDQHTELVDIAAKIGLIAEMPHWATAWMTSKLDSAQDLKELTIGELLSMHDDTSTYVNETVS